MTTFYIVRHGESEANAHFDSFRKVMKDRVLGAELTELGIQQAKDLAERFKDIHFDYIFASEKIRTQKTAEILAQERKVAVLTTEVINERDMGSLSGKTDEELRAELNELFEKFDKLDEEEKFQFKFADDMESNEEAATRLITFLRETAIAYPEKIILVVCHSAIMRSLLTKLGFATYSQLPPGSVENTGYVILEVDGVDFFIKETEGINKIENIH